MKARCDYQPIEDHGVIGNLRTVALISKKASIDFMCFPNFDSPSIFAALLDSSKGGFFQIKPITDNFSEKQLYLPETNILVTRFLLDEGMGEITDFMPTCENKSQKNILIRKVHHIKGEMTYQMQCSPRFNYGRSKHKANHHKNRIIFTSLGEDKTQFSLNSSVPLRVSKGDAIAEFTLKANETAEFILEQNNDDLTGDVNIKQYVDEAFTETHQYWKAWTRQTVYNGHWREMVIRSALILKLLISNEYGSIIAAPTFSLPEKLGGNKNWDYRFSWTRDASFTIYALMRIGYTNEAESFMNWIQKLCDNLETNAHLQPVYRYDCNPDLTEIELPNLEGYMHSPPVRIGNKAAEQLQIDIYGEFMDAIYLYDKFVAPIPRDVWLTLLKQIEWVIANWKSKDRGIWEIRGKPREFLYSRLMCWVAMDRIIKIGIQRAFPFPFEWIGIRNEIFDSIYKDFWCKKRQAFVQFKNGSEMDASTLLMSLFRFVSPKDPAWLSTLKAIEEDLVYDCLVYRYKPEEAELFGLIKGEGTFAACSFWYIENLSRSGQIEKAQIYFDKMLSYANHLGLYSEQLGFKGEQLGNFPQAFTHLSLISAAFDLNKRLVK